MLSPSPSVRRMIGSTSVIGARRSTTTDTVTRVPLWMRNDGPLDDDHS